MEYYIHELCYKLKFIARSQIALIQQIQLVALSFFFANEYVLETKLEEPILGYGNTAKSKLQLQSPFYFIYLFVVYESKAT